MMKKIIIILISIIIIVNARKECASRVMGDGGSVCVCNATYCDDLDPIKRETPGIVTVFETNKHGLRLKESKLKFNHTSHNENDPKESQKITIDSGKKFQEITGFGGAFTDAAGINIVALPKNMQHNLIKDYFSSEGLEYSVGRVPIGGSDFSTHGYSYDDNHPKDFNLTHFSLTEEDYKYKIPIIKEAQKMSPHKLRIFGSPWSSPAWMKDNNNLIHGGFIIGKPGGEYYQAFADYFVKFLEAYKKNGVDVWGITIENEPGAGYSKTYRWNCLGFSPELQRDFIKLNLGPTLDKAGYGHKNFHVMIYDDQRTNIKHWSDVILNDKEAAKYVWGIAFHWYSNTEANVVNLDETHKAHPNFPMLGTEACYERFSLHTTGNWHKGEHYAYDIIKDLQHWATGWVDWNLVLDMEGGPNWVKNFVDAPILVNASAHEYYKQPMFYTLGHFSKFLIPGSVRVHLTQEPQLKNLEVIAFERPDKSIVLTVLNLNDHDVHLNINDPKHGKLSASISAHAIQTYLWSN